MTQQQIKYYAQTEEINFSEDELVRMGIVFINDLNEIKDSLRKLNIQNIGEHEELVDYGYVLSQLGKLNDPLWAIYSIEHSFQYVSDMWNKKNFYTIFRDTGKSVVPVFSRVHLREDSVEEDALYYIELDLEMLESSYLSPDEQKHIH